MKVNIPIIPDRGNWIENERARQFSSRSIGFSPSSFHFIPWIIIVYHEISKKKKTRQAWNNVITLVVKNI